MQHSFFQKLLLSLAPQLFYRQQPERQTCEQFTQLLTLTQFRDAFSLLLDKEILPHTLVYSGLYQDKKHGIKMHFSSSGRLDGHGKIKLIPIFEVVDCLQMIFKRGHVRVSDEEQEPFWRYVAFIRAKAEQEDIEGALKKRLGASLSPTDMESSKKCKAWRL